MNEAWKEAQAAALDAQAAALAAGLAELDNVEQVLESRGRTKILAELRGLTASLRSERTEMQAEARQLRPPRDGMPLALTGGPTTRRQRRHLTMEEQPYE